MTPIKVLHVLDQEPEAFYFNNLVDHTDPGEICFSFANFAPAGKFNQDMHARGVTVHTFPRITKVRFFRARAELAKVLNLEGPAVVHTHLFNPTVVGLHVAKRRGLATVLTRHHSDALHQLTGVKRAGYLALDYRNNRLADRIIAPSKLVRDILVDVEGTPADKVIVIPYGQTYERFGAVTEEQVDSIRDRLGMNNQLSLVCVSRLFHRKGHIFLFDALAPLIRDGLSVKLFLVGDGDYKDELKKRLTKLGIADHVVFLGWRSDVLDLIAAADLVVHPSLEDALSQSLIESLMLGRPIIATDISGASDTLGGGKYGKLVPPADADALRAAIAQMIGDLESARAMAAQGKAHLLEYMDAGKVAAQYTEVYRELVNERRR